MWSHRVHALQKCVGAWNCGYPVWWREGESRRCLLRDQGGGREEVGQYIQPWRLVKRNLRGGVG
jgi:hypothetical protein